MEMYNSVKTITRSETLKKYLPLAISMLLLAACSTKDDNATAVQNESVTETKTNEWEVTTSNIEVNTDSNQKTDSTVTNLKSTAASANFQSIIPSNWAVKVPNDFPVTKGRYLTAITKAKNNVITFNFYETSTKLAINNKNIKQNGKYVGQLTITKYASKKLASAEIDQTVFNQGKAVKLGHGITGFQDAGAGSLFTSWNEGRWAIIARSLTEKPKESLTTARETVEFLDTHMLPIPKEYGYLHVDAEQSGTMAKWQKENYLYAMTNFGKKTLPWIVKFK